MSTDVAGSISGYYKQIYVAVQELLSLKSENSSVGIECGADVRTFHSNNVNKSIEVKFYKNKIGLYSPEISKTIYNFYLQSYNDIKLTFNSNTEMPESNIFVKKEDKLTIDYTSKKQFVLHCLIKYHINKNEQYKRKITNYFKQCGTTCNKCDSFCCDSCISNFVQKNIDLYPSKFQEIININKNVNIDEFSSKIQFVFENRNKIESMTLIKNNLIKLLKDNFDKYTYNLSNVILEAIIQKVAISFFDTAVFNSILKNNESVDYNNHKKLFRNDVIEFINNYEDFLEEYKNDVLEFRIIELVEKANLDKEKILFKFNQEYNEYLMSKSIIDAYDSSSIKEYFKKIDMKFKSEDEGNEVVKRFMLYNDGLGIISYLITLKINEISVYENKMFIKADFDDGIFIENKGYYKFKLISQYVNKNKRSEDGFYRYAKIDNISYLEIISEACKTPFIKIDKLSKSTTLDEYQKINNISLETINKLRNILSSDSNLLIINRYTMNRTPFLNALISAIPNNLNPLIIAEDINTSPANEKQNTITIVDSLKDDYESNINSLSLLVGNYDKCIALIDNYELDIYNIYKHYLLLLNNVKCLITTFNRDTSNFEYGMTFEKINKELSGYENLDFSMFDYFIILDNYYVQDNKQDVIKIIGK